MSLARLSGPESAIAERPSPPLLGPLGVGGIVIVIVAAAVKLRQRRRPTDAAGLSDRLRRDVGLPPQTENRGWWDF